MNLKEKAFEFFDRLKTGQVVLIKDIAKNDPESFKQYIRDYIDQGGNLTVSDDWRKFRKESDEADFRQIA